ncbi:MAG: DUF3419 family protein [Bacteroidetes bacterium]|nr:MAG: DUF3419 family protein [Bacteroidota bacterium]
MPQNVDFSFIRYANGWEDTELLLNNLKPKAGDKILSIAAAGDNSLAFLAFNPEIVIAFDISEPQLYLTELKQQAIKILDYQDLLAFLGIIKTNHLEKLFQQIKPNLSNACLHYFTEHFYLIQNGLIHQGKFENYFKLFRTYVLPLIHNQARINQLFEPKSEGKQIEFYNNEWNTWRWRCLFKLFFSKYLLGKLGRDPEFFNENKLHVSQTIFKAAEKHLCSSLVFNNHYLDFQLRGNFTVNLPYYLIEDNYVKIKANIDKLILKKGYLTDVKLPYKFELANLSNIFEYMDEKLFTIQVIHLSQIMNENSKLASWNLFVPRKIEQQNPEFYSLKIEGNDLCFFYNSFNLNQFKV